MVFQNPDNQLVATIVEEDVAFGPENLGLPPAEIRRRVDEALDIVGMSQFARHSPHQLSGGQKQRIAIAGIIALRPDVIIFDESTAMLDPKGRADVLDTIEKLNREYGTTILHITHYMEEAAEADYVVILDSGKIAAEGTPLMLKNLYTGDYITMYGATKEQAENLQQPFTAIRDGFRISVPNTQKATELILAHPELFKDYEITKGKMDDVFLAVTGKKLTGGDEK